MTTADIIGTIGVALLLLAFALNLMKKLAAGGVTYALMNMVGAGLACLASWMIDYMPFVVLEGTWFAVSLAALIGAARTSPNATRNP